MGAARDEISSTMNRLEQAMRQQGAVGERLGDLSRDLSRRCRMPKTVAKAIKEVDTFSLRAISPAAQIDELALGLWRAKVDHISQWLDTAPSIPVKERGARRITTNKPLLSWLEPWMLIAVLFLLGCGWALVVKLDIHLLVPAQRQDRTTGEPQAPAKLAEHRATPMRAPHTGYTHGRRD